MLNNRASGVLLHPTSLPGSYGIGDLGGQAFEWVNFLQTAGCGFWQVLPLGPTGYGDSPYQCFSAFAGNRYLINPEPLFGIHILSRQDISDLPIFSSSKVEYGRVIQWKLSMLQKAYETYMNGSFPDLDKQIARFIQDEEFWLQDYAVFMTIKETYQNQPWNLWPDPLRFHEERAIESFISEHPREIKRHIFEQFIFSQQWRNLRRFANEKGIQIIGDIPIYVSYDSADCWSHPELFMFNENRLPISVGGTPPDLFSNTGQLWGNPIYRWEIHNKTGYRWWIERIQSCLKNIDYVRLDHFRGFGGFWDIPAGDPTARDGVWKDGPGIKFLLAIQKALGDLPIIAEDLGEITQDVFVLRDLFNLPGMKVLQFAFYGSPDDSFFPHNYEKNFIAYTGNHDNDTAVGWLKSTSPEARQNCLKYLHSDGQDIAWDMIRAVWASVASITIAPLQDFLSLGNEARMNFPGRSDGNWDWRVDPKLINQDLAKKIWEINYIYARLNK